MDQEQLSGEEKKLWMEPELTFMPMKKIKSMHFPGHHEVLNDSDDFHTGS